tara:strand:+ start:196 stop:381 length:186 start_codon:yes stop_codon:yes gene_type:complete
MTNREAIDKLSEDLKSINLFMAGVREQLERINIKQELLGVSLERRAKITNGILNRLEERGN